MIDDVLIEIKSAEEKAEAMQKEAYQQGKDIVLAAEIEAEKQKKMTVAECKADQKSAVEQAEAKATKNREDILKKGRLSADKLVEEKQDSIEIAADKILDMLLAKY